MYKLMFEKSKYSRLKRCLANVYIVDIYSTDVYYRGSSSSVVSKSVDFTIVWFWKLSNSLISMGEFCYSPVFFKMIKVKKLLALFKESHN